MSKLRKNLLVFAIGPLIGVIQVAGLVLGSQTVDAPIKLAPIVWTMVNATVWGLFLPLIVRWSERDPLTTEKWRGQALRHTARSIAISIGTGIVVWAVRLAAFSVLGTEPLSAREIVGRLFGSWMLYDAFLYAVLLGIVSALASQYELREKALDAARLQATLAETEIKLLKAELDPHFLFNALHTISALVHRDPEAADRMICRLSDFLRLSLSTAASPEVSLQQELEHLQSYMEIQMVRFRGRLTLEVEVAAELLSCRVPNLLLQPLIENVVKHAVSASHRPVHASVRARRDRQQLVLEISDNGPGLPSSGADGLREGIGLTNTRGRLEKLYGSEHRIMIGTRSGGGMQVSIAVPYALSDDAAGATTQDDRRPGEDFTHAARSHR
ncbi:MAG: histidine kinase [Acidobacteriota bacterium]